VIRKVSDKRLWFRSKLKKLNAWIHHSSSAIAAFLASTLRVGGPIFTYCAAEECVCSVAYEYVTNFGCRSHRHILVRSLVPGTRSLRLCRKRFCKCSHQQPIFASEIGGSHRFSSLSPVHHRYTRAPILQSVDGIGMLANDLQLENDSGPMIE
jgi:hypothetical protein